jgi:Methyltransferase domain
MSSAAGYRARRAARLTGGMFVPHSVVVLVRAARLRRHSRRALAQDLPTPALAPRRFDAEEAVNVLLARGLDEEGVRAGSIKPAHLQFLDASIREHLRTEPPHRALHVGNFVGISLAALSGSLLDLAAATDPLVISIDPNIPHNDIADPQTATLALLSHFGYQRNNLVICGYSLEKSLGNEGERTAGYDPEQAYASEVACENVLSSLTALGLALDVALVDGSHNASYLRRELEAIVPLLRPGALLILDDVTDVWVGIRDLFGELGAADSPWPLEVLDHDGRIGVLRRAAAAGSPQGETEHRVSAAEV